MQIVSLASMMPTVFLFGIVVGAIIGTLCCLCIFKDEFARLRRRLREAEHGFQGVEHHADQDEHFRQMMTEMR